MTFLQSHSPNMNVQSAGRGTPVVLLHGSASNAKQWRSLTDYLKGHFRVIAPDLPGYGKSAAPVTAKSPGIVDTANDISTMVDCLSEPVHIVAHSFGAAIALKFAAMHPGKLRSLTLIEPAVFNAFWSTYGNGSTQTRDFVAMGTRFKSLLAQGRDEDAIRIFIDFWNGDGAWDRTGSKLQAKLKGDARRVLDDFEALAQDVTTEYDLAGIVCPVTLLRGGASPAVMEALTGHLVEKLPFVEELTFPECGHMLPLTDPHLTDPAIGNFLKKVDRTWQNCQGSLARAA